ncbi:MAG: hypothetical protein IBX69_07355, partial [Anaerolineales bacterium]|nr:hypothetical protein [Anaerolineales bacterium]
MSTSTLITPTSMDTATITPTQRETYTPQPTATFTLTPPPTNTPTSTPHPTLTPAFPFIEDDRYNLMEFSPGIANRLIGLMEAYPDTLSIYARGEDQSGYFSAFTFAVFALRESLFRLPDANQANDWYWNLVYNLARTGDEDVGQAFPELITGMLNEDLVRLDELVTWGKSRKPPVQIFLTSLAVPSGYLSNNIVQINAGENGGLVFWLLERPSGFIAYPLSSIFDFRQPTLVNFITADLNGNGFEEVVIYRSPPPDSLTYSFPEVFDLSSQPPKQLSFGSQQPPEIAPNYRNIWIPSESPDGNKYLNFVDTVFPACPVHIRHIYRWDGFLFEFLSAEYEIEPTQSLLNYCSLVIDHALNSWGVDTAVNLMEILIPDWPPQENDPEEVYQKEALDEWRFRLGIYHALLNNREPAIGYLESIIANPASQESRWIVSAQSFLETYQSQRDIYQACSLSRLCEF